MSETTTNSTVSTEVTPAEVEVNNDVANESKQSKTTVVEPVATVVLTPEELLVQKLEQQLAEAKANASKVAQERERKATQIEHDKVQSAIDKMQPRLTEAKAKVEKANSDLTKIQTELEQLMSSDPWLAIERKYSPPSPTTRTRRTSGGRKSTKSTTNNSNNGVKSSESEPRDWEFDVFYAYLTDEQVHDMSPRIQQTTHCVLGRVDNKYAMIRACGEMHRRHRVYNTLQAIKAALSDTYNDNANKYIELTDLTKLDTPSKAFVDNERNSWTATRDNYVHAHPVTVNS